MSEADFHRRLDALGVPACETEVCLECITVVAAGGDSNGCNACHGTGQRQVTCRISARLDWVADKLAQLGFAEADLARVRAAQDQSRG